MATILLLGFLRRARIKTAKAMASRAASHLALVRSQRKVQSFSDSQARFVGNHVPVPFHDLVLEAVRRCRSLAAARSVTVVPMLATNDAAVEVLGDAVLLEAMIENLVRNAVVSAPQGTLVELQVRLLGDEVLLSVRDHGTQVDDESLDSVFEGFFEVPEPSRPVSNTGLSLAIAKRVAEHHRGTISLRNVSGGGCEFEVQLPRWRPDGQPTTSAFVGSK